MLRLAHIVESAVAPALTWLRLDSTEARLMLLAIGLQESNLEHRCQVLPGGKRGPARGLWQFEKGGVLGVLRHHLSAEPLRLLCRSRDVALDVVPIWQQLESDDVLAAGVARLLLYTDPKRLPAIGEVDAAWDYYERNWRPGKPHPDRWADCYALAAGEVLGAMG